LAGLILLRRRSRLPPRAFFWRATVGLVLCADLLIFVVSPFHLFWNLATAFNRLLLQLYPLALLMLAEQVAASGWFGGRWETENAFADDPPKGLSPPAENNFDLRMWKK
jgi:hypothetical protein